MRSLTITEVVQQLPDLINAIQHGEEIIITKDNCSVAKIVPATSNKPRPRFGSAKGLITMSDDFDEPLEDFKEYM